METERTPTHPEVYLQGARCQVPDCTWRQKPEPGFSPLPSVPPTHPQVFSSGPPARHKFQK